MYEEGPASVVKRALQHVIKLFTDAGKAVTIIPTSYICMFRFYGLTWYMRSEGLAGKDVRKDFIYV